MGSVSTISEPKRSDKRITPHKIKTIYIPRVSWWTFDINEQKSTYFRAHFFKIISYFHITECCKLCYEI